MSQPEPEESPQQEAIVEETQPQPAEPEPNVPVEVKEPPAAVAETPKLAPESEVVRRPTLNDDSRDPTVNDESMEQDLKKNKAVKIELPPPMSNRQLLMLAVFIILEAFHSLLTLSLGPIAPAMTKAYDLNEYFNRILIASPIIACLIGYYPTFKVITGLGMRYGLASCLVVSLIGTIVTYFIDTNANLFLIGHLLVLLGMQSIHTAKGLFVNLYFPEKNRGRALIIITAVNMITSVLGSILLHYLILRADVLVLSDETLKSRIQLYSIFKIGVTATLMVLILIIFATNTAQSLLEANTTMDKDESQLLYQYAGFSIPFGTQLKDLLGDKIFMVFLIGTNLGIAGIEGIEDSISFLLLNFDIRLSQARVIKAVTMLCAALGIVAYIKLFLMKSHQLFYLLIGNFIMAAFFFFYWFSFQFGYLLTLITAVPFGLFSTLQLVISLEQVIRYLNRVHPEKVLVGTSFYLMLMQLLRQTFKLSVEKFSDPRSSTALHYLPCIIVEGLVLLTSISAAILNKWLYAERVNLDKPHYKAQLLPQSEQVEPKADTTYNAEIEMEIY